MSQADFYNFEEALDQLRLREEELKRLVSEGEIRAFRDGETMKLRKTDVENLKNELLGGEVVDLGAVSDELVFEDDAGFDDTGMATEEISDMDTLLEDDVEDVGEIDLEPEPEVVAAAPVRRTQTALASRDEPEQESVGMRAVLIATTAVLVLAMPVALSISNGSVSDLARTIAGMFPGVEL